MEYDLENKDNNIINAINESSHSKLSYFKQLSQKLASVFMRPINVAPPLSQNDQIKKEVSKKFNQYVNNDIWVFAVELIENGYEPTQVEKEKLLIVLAGAAKDSSLILEFKKIMDIIPEEYLKVLVQSNPQIIFDLMEVKYDIPESICYIALTGNIVNSNQIPKNYNALIKDYVSEENASLILTTIVNNLKNSVNNYLTNLNIRHVNIGFIGDGNDEKTNEIIMQMQSCELFIKYSNHLLKADSLENALQSINKIENNVIEKCRKVASCHRGEYFASNKANLKTVSYRETIDNIQEIFQEKLSLEKDEFVNKIKQVNGNKVLEKKIKSSINASLISVKMELPISVQPLLKDINNKYNLMQDNIISAQLIEINNLYENRLPEILKKFLVIDKEYRTELKNIQGKNAEQLMVESLNNIVDIFDKKLEEVNQERLSDLSVTQRYTQSIKQKM